jgi:hypothetical protein
MSYALINLTLPIVVQEIENVLDDYPEYPYHSAFSIHELRQKLIAHVLSHVPNRYAVEGIQELPSSLKVRHTSPLAERLNTEMIIRAGILHILRENADWLSRNLPLLETQ